MRFDLADLGRLSGFAGALGRLFWCLIAVAFFSALLGSPGTGLLVLVLAAAAFVVRVGLEDFVGSRGEEPEREPVPPPEFAVYRASRRPRRSTEKTETFG